jgi:methyl-accepting chemotaxis protein
MLVCGGFVALLVCVSGIALFRLAGIQSSVDQLVDARIPRIEMAYEIKLRLDQIGLSMRNMAIMTRASDLQAQVEQVQSERQAIAKVLETLKAQIDSEKGKSLLAKIAEQRGRYVPAQERYLELVKHGKLEDAKAYLLETARPLQLAYFAAVDELLAYQSQLVQVTEEEAEAAAHSARAWLIAVSLAGLVLAALSGVWISRSLMRQLGGEPTEASALAASVADGDLTRAVELRTGDSSSMMAQLQTMQARLSDVVANVRSNSESVATASAQIAQGNQDLSQRTEEQASALEQTAATMTELAETVRHNADNAAQASQLARGATTVAVRGGEVVGQVVGTMHAINESSRKISDIIGVIDGIAFQTNILALNAAVEAARAGEQGRGFAVVASEVRALAQRSAEAAKEIKTLINHSVGQVAQGTQQVEQAGQTMEEIVTSIRRVSDVVNEISTASVEQNKGIQQVGEAVGQMDVVTQQNAALVEEGAAAAESLRQQAEQLVDVVRGFRLAA